MSEDEGGPAQKRLRISRACDPCRRRKERCDGAQPACQRCTGAGRRCFYNPYRKRGLRPGYVRALEILLGLVLHGFPDAEALILSVLQHQPLDALVDTSHRPASGRTQEISSLLGSWRESAILRQVQTTLDSTEAVEDEEGFVQRLDDNLTSAYRAIPRQAPFSAPAEDTIREDDSLQPQSPAPRLLSSTISFQRQDLGNLAPPSSTPFSGVASYPASNLPSNWSHLIEVYLTETHSWFPVIQRFTLFRTASLTASADRNPNARRPNDGEIALLWAIFAYSSYELQHGASTAESSVMVESNPNESFADIYAQAKSLALLDQSQFELGHVNAYLTLALLEMRRGAWLSAWLWVGRAVYTANIVGILPSRLDQPRSDDQRRCFLGCFLLDSLLSTRLGFRPYMKRADLANGGSITEDGPEEWEAWRPGPNQSFTPSTSPGHVLSTFNSLCFMTSMAGKYGDDSIHPRPQLTDLFSHLAHSEHHCWLLGTQSSDSLLNEPPYVVQAKLAAATAYSTSQSQAVDANSSQGGAALHDALIASLQTIAHIATPVDNNRSHVDVSRLPPTAQIFVQLLGRPRHTHHMSAEDQDTLMDSLPSGRSMMQREQDRSVPTASAWLSSSASAACASRPDAAMGASLVDMPPPRTDGLQPTVNLLSPAPDTGLSMPYKDGQKDPVDPALSRLMPVLTSPRSSRLQEQGAPDLGHGDLGSQGVGISNDISGSDGLFNQLVSLDSSEWPAISEEFMEHLGLSRDGSLFEFQNLLAPPREAREHDLL